VWHNAAQPLVNTDGSACNYGIFDVLHFVRDHGDGVVDGVLSKDFRIVGAGGNRLLQNPLADISWDHGKAPFYM
jgi:hypothetical protein